MDCLENNGDLTNDNNGVYFFHGDTLGIYALMFSNMGWEIPLEVQIWDIFVLSLDM